MHHVELNSVTSKLSEKKSFYTLEDIDLREIKNMQNYIKNRVKLWEKIEFKG